MDDNNRIAIGVDVSDRTACVCVIDRSGILDEFKVTLDEDSLRTRIPLVSPERGGGGVRDGAAFRVVETGVDGA